MIGGRPELVAGGSVRGEVPPEGDRRARDGDVGGLQRDLPQGTPHPGRLARVRDDAERTAFLPADQTGPVQRVLQARGAVVIEGGGELRGSDVERDRPQRRVGVRRDGPLGVAQIAGAGHRHLAVAPRLAPQPGHGGQPVLPFGKERAELATRAERPAGALDEHLEALARQRRREQERRASPAVRRADQHHRERPVMPGGPVVIAQQGNAVRHRHRDVAPDHVGRRGCGKAKRAVDRLAGDPGQRVHSLPLPSASRLPRPNRLPARTGPICVSTSRTHRLQTGCTRPVCAQGATVDGRLPGTGGPSLGDRQAVPVLAKSSRSLRSGKRPVVSSGRRTVLTPYPRSTGTAGSPQAAQAAGGPA